MSVAVDIRHALSTVILAMSKSERNSTRLYFKCPKGSCSLSSPGTMGVAGRLSLYGLWRARFSLARIPVT